jgi:hypothetical protein
MQVNENSWKVQYYLNFKDNHIWHHGSLTKLNFIKSTSVKYIIFYHFYKLHQISYAPVTEKGQDNNLTPLISSLWGNVNGCLSATQTTLQWHESKSRASVLLVLLNPKERYTSLMQKPLSWASTGTTVTHTNRQNRTLEIKIHSL